MHTALAPFLGLTTSHEAVKQAEKLVMQSLGVIESVWLKGDAKFLLGSPQPSIADLSLVCEIMQLEVCMLTACWLAAAAIQIQILLGDDEPLYVCRSLAMRSVTDSWELMRGSLSGWTR